MLPWAATAANVVCMDDVTLGEGAVFSPFVTLTSNIRIGRHFHANLYSYVEHDCVVGDFVTFAPGVHCNGNVVIEDRCLHRHGCRAQAGPARPAAGDRPRRGGGHGRGGHQKRSAGCHCGGQPCQSDVKRWVSLRVMQNVTFSIRFGSSFHPFLTAC